MKLLFTASPKIGSRLIRWGLEEPVSHVAIECDGLVLHSTWTRVDIDTLEHFLKDREVVHQIDVIGGGLPELIRIAGDYEGASYDFLGLARFACCALRRKFFGIALPAVNPWNTPNNFLCTELATHFLWQEEDGSITPYELYCRIAGIPYDNPPKT